MPVEGSSLPKSWCAGQRKRLRAQKLPAIIIERMDMSRNTYGNKIDTIRFKEYSTQKIVKQGEWRYVYKILCKCRFLILFNIIRKVQISL